MVSGVGKTPRYELTDRERQQCLEALLSDRHARRLRRAEEKDINQGGDKKITKKGTRKRAVKHTTAVMEIAESKAAEAKEVAVGQEGMENEYRAEAKMVAVTPGVAEQAKETEEAKETKEAKETEVVKEMDVEQVADVVVSEVITDIVVSVSLTETEEQSTYLNSGEDMSLREELEGEDDGEDVVKWIRKIWHWNIQERSDLDVVGPDVM
ncbi:Pleiotropic drug resistance protein [Phytophthora palmivora]|uniref:Pleiotropic drug resistance protein n=1 Tax=Phytophthora palmivora TaxID=4796 RepID=A0A2P4YHE8_9STRA|nr:Pleiotropic drug resistance protein [Phytophthora palmivora]